MRVLICGSRDWDDPWLISTAVLFLLPWRDTLIHGGCPTGADAIADEIARRFERPVEVYPADWEKHGKAAGPIRNQQMLDEGKPDRVIAFTDDLTQSRGTADMVRRAKAAGLPVYVVSRV